MTGGDGGKKGFGIRSELTNLIINIYLKYLSFNILRFHQASLHKCHKVLSYRFTSLQML